MKATMIVSKKEETIKTPCLMIDRKKEIILLVTNYDGDCLIGSIVWLKNYNDHFIGEHNDDWSTDFFEPFYGKITLEQ